MAHQKEETVHLKAVNYLHENLETQDPVVNLMKEKDQDNQNEEKDLLAPLGHMINILLLKLKNHLLLLKDQNVKYVMNLPVSFHVMIQTVGNLVLENNQEKIKLKQVRGSLGWD